MIPAKTLIYAFNLQYDRIDNDLKSNLRLEDKLFYINKSVQLYVKKLLKYAEANSEIRTSLRPLEKKEIELEIIKRGKAFDIANIPKECLKLLRQRVLASKPKCGKKELTLIKVSTDDLNLSRKSPYWASSFEWEHCLCDEGNDGLYLYHEGLFKADKVIVDYYRKPNDIHAATLHENRKYIDWNGNMIEFDSGLELDANYDYQDIINIAILMAKADSGDVGDFELQLSKFLNLDKLNL